MYIYRYTHISGYYQEPKKLEGVLQLMQKCIAFLWLVHIYTFISIFYLCRL